MTPRRAYQPYEPARRPGGRPPIGPAYRVLVHRRYQETWSQLGVRVGIENAQQFWDHVAHHPGRAPDVGTSSILKGSAGKPLGDGWSRTVHYEISGAGRINYQFNNGHRARPDGDPHSVVKIITIDLSSH